MQFRKGWGRWQRSHITWSGNNQTKISPALYNPMRLTSWGQVHGDDARITMLRPIPMPWWAGMQQDECLACLYLALPADTAGALPLQEQSISRALDGSGVAGKRGSFSPPKPVVRESCCHPTGTWLSWSMAGTDGSPTKHPDLMPPYTAQAGCRQKGGKRSQKGTSSTWNGTLTCQGL